MNNFLMTAYIQAIGTALPPFVTEQGKIADFMVRQLHLNSAEEKKLRVLYRASGIQKRYSVLQDFNKNLNGKSFFKEEGNFPSAKPRMMLYQQHALTLGAAAVSQALALSALQPTDITHLIAVSCTGMYAPGLDIELIESLGLNTDTKRTSINFMGCYAAFNALKMAGNIIGSEPDSNVLIVCVELCSIHLQEKKDDENLLANAIFGDGSAAVVLNGSKGKKSLELSSFFSDLALQGKDEMGWYIGDYGFEMRLSANVPEVIRNGIGELTDRLLEQISLKLSNIDYYAIHPGGKRILDVIEEQLNISKDENRYAREILRSFGNMSSPTVLFVIKSIFDGLKLEDDQKHILSFAFGPGLTLESAILKAHIHA